MHVTLTNNDSRHFECRWINLRIEPQSKCVFLNTSDGGRLSSRSHDSSEVENNGMISLQVAHGEGKFFANNKALKAIEQSNLVVFRYVDASGKLTQKYPENPNGSLNAIAGITDKTGRVLGLMPHPERFVKVEQHPNWRRMKIAYPHGLPIFENMIKYINSS